jgi:CHAT domain-containing protein/Tfp pilus assembly protein PilF
MTFPRAVRATLCGVTLLSLAMVGPRPSFGQPAAPLQRAKELQAEAGTLSNQGRYRDAIAPASEALALREGALGPDDPAVAQSLDTLATVYVTTGDYAQARPLYERALAIQERAFGPQHREVATTLNGLGYLLSLTGDHASARSLVERGLQIREREVGPDHVTVAASLNTLGFVLYASSDLAAARPILERALAIREKALGATHPLVAQTAMNLGRLHGDRGDYAAARPLLERAVRIYESSRGPSHPLVGTSLRHLGRLQQLQGDLVAARASLERTLRIREQTLGPDHPDVAYALGTLGDVLVLQAEYVGAYALYARALAIQERRLGRDHPDVAVVLVDLAIVQRHRGDFAGARSLLQRALEIRESALRPQHPAVANSLGALAFLDYMVGDYAAARPLYERALAIREAAQGPEHRDVAGVLSDFGLLLQATGDLTGARRAYERALSVKEKALGPDHVQLAPTLNNLAALFRQTGDYAAARPFAERGLRIRERALGPDHPDVSRSLVDLAYILHSMKDNAAARPLYERAIQICERAFGPDAIQVAGALNALGFFLQDTRRLAEARPVHERALRIRERVFGPDHVNLVQSLNNLGVLSRQVGDYAAAQRYYERALPIERRADRPEMRWRVTYGLGMVYERTGRLADALPLYRESAATVEGLARQFGDDAQRTQYLQADSRLRPYDALSRVLLKLHESDSSRGYDHEAWAVLEAKKGRVVADALAAARPTLRDPAAREEVEQVHAQAQRARGLERALADERERATAKQDDQRVANLTTLLAKTKAEYLAQAQAFLAKYPQYKAQFVDQQTIDPKALAKFSARLPAATMVVQYFAATDRLYLFVVGPDNRFAVKSRAITQDSLYALVKDYRHHLEAAAAQRLPWTDDGSPEYGVHVAPLRAVGAKLSALLLDPVASELRTYENLVLIPNDLLLYLPIHALTFDGRFLAETHRVSYVTQLELADLLNPPTPVANTPLLALGNPDGSLPAAGREVRELARIRGGATALEGEQATKERFLALVSRFPDLHLATHGILDAKQPEKSYLLMAGADDASQRLGIAEIASLSLGGRGLAVLSACETALGEQVPGAALITLAAAFSQAGAQSIVASLWKVNDGATRDLMVNFHRALGSVGRAEALQRAQVAVLGKPATAHPYYWAAFVLIGAR